MAAAVSTLPPITLPSPPDSTFGNECSEVRQAREIRRLRERLLALETENANLREAVDLLWDASFK